MLNAASAPITTCWSCAAAGNMIYGFFSGQPQFYSQLLTYYASFDERRATQMAFFSAGVGYKRAFVGRRLRSY